MMVPWVRDDTFLEGTAWKKGVGEMTPAIIKLPFWDMTAKNEHVFYVCMNQKPSAAPKHLDGKSMYIEGNLAESLRDLRGAVKVEKESVG